MHHIEHMITFSPLSENKHFLETERIIKPDLRSHDIHNPKWQKRTIWSQSLDEETLKVTLSNPDPLTRILKWVSVSSYSLKSSKWAVRAPLVYHSDIPSIPCERSSPSQCGLKKCRLNSTLMLVVNCLTFYKMDGVRNWPALTILEKCYIFNI
jgi:hypothetical protein